MQLHGTTVLITGGAGGIGAALVCAFSGRGATVVTLDLPGTDADLCVDVADRVATSDAIASLPRLDVVVANAGVGVGGLVEDIPAEDWDRVIDVNVRGALNVVLPGYTRMRAQRSGALVLMASLAGLAGTPGLTPYAMSKSAIVGLGSSLRPEAARFGVGVSTVCPGPVETPLLDAPARTGGMSARRYLVATAGSPLPAGELADQVVRAVERNSALVVPGRAGLLWRLARVAPRLTARQVAKGFDRELRTAGVADA